MKTNEQIYNELIETKEEMYKDFVISGCSWLIPEKDLRIAFELAYTDTVQ